MSGIPISRLVALVGGTVEIQLLLMQGATRTIVRATVTLGFSTEITRKVFHPMGMSDSDTRLQALYWRKDNNKKPSLIEEVS